MRNSGIGTVAGEVWLMTPVQTLGRDVDAYETHNTSACQVPSCSTGNTVVLGTEMAHNNSSPSLKLYHSLLSLPSPACAYLVGRQNQKQTEN